MNTFEQNIISRLEEQSILSTLKSHLEKKPDHSHIVNGIQVRLDDSIVLIEYLKKILLQSIDNSVFSQLPVTMQGNFNSQVQTLFQHRTNVNQQIINAQSLYQQVIYSNIEYNQKSYDRFKKNLSDISDLKRKYSSTLKSLDLIKSKVDIIESLYKESIELHSDISNEKELFDEKLNSTKETFSNSSGLLNSIKEAGQDVENSKKEILAFKANIESYKGDIESNSSQAKLITDDFESKRKQVENLIKESEKALGLKSSEGISAALSVQYSKEDDVSKRKQWIVASVIFLFIAMFGVSLLIFNISFGEKSISSGGISWITARVVFVAIAISCASFSAKQYLRQKTLADNYGYKLVLAKSIVAFAQEIKKHDPKKSAEYLNNVLAEINKSPIPDGNSKEDGLTKKNIGIFEKVINLIKDNK